MTQPHNFDTRHPPEQKKQQRYFAAPKTRKSVLLRAYFEGTRPAWVIESEQVAWQVSLPRALGEHGADVPSNLLHTAGL